MRGNDALHVLKFVRIDAEFDCGARTTQLVRAAPSFRGSEWLDYVLFTAGDDAGTVFVGEVRALLRRTGGDVAVICEMAPAAPDPGCPLTARGCTRLRWMMRPCGEDTAVRLVPVERIRRVLNVVPDFRDLSARLGYEASPAMPHSPLAARLAMRYFLNAFYPWGR